MKINDLIVLAAMAKYGGTFVEHISLAAMAADEENYQRLKFTFKDIWDKYEAMIDTDKQEVITPEAVCQSCFKAIRYNGGRWEHIPGPNGEIPRHVPTRSLLD